MSRLRALLIAVCALAPSGVGCNDDSAAREEPRAPASPPPPPPAPGIADPLTLDQVGLGPGGPWRGEVVLEEGAARVTGTLDHKTVTQYIRRYLSGVRWCCEERLKTRRELGGKATLAFTIGPNGATVDPQLTDSTLGDAVLEGCIVSKMARWRYPQPRDGGTVEVAYPILLETR